MKMIPLTQGKVALVDDTDFEAVNIFKWHANKSGRNFYAARNIRRADGSHTLQLLHQFLLPGVPRIDHKDGNSLNDQRGNLRPATAAQNSRGFRRKPEGVSSVYRGVGRHSDGKKWESRIMIDGKSVYLGLFILESDAARAYDAAARKHFVDFASPNYPH